jgi:hypothetical protein
MVGLTGPSGGLANIGKLYRICATAFRRDVCEQDSLLRASDRERAIFGGYRPKAIELSTAKPSCRRCFLTATPANGTGVERHRVFAGTDQQTPGGIRYRGHDFWQPFDVAGRPLARVPEKYILSLQKDDAGCGGRADTARGAGEVWVGLVTMSEVSGR